MMVVLFLSLIGCVKVESHLNKHTPKSFALQNRFRHPQRQALMQATYRGGALVYMPIALPVESYDGVSMETHER